MLSFGQRLRILRKEVNLSQNDLAERLLVSVQSVSKWECDNTMPDISQIVPLAAILGVTTDCLLGVGTDEKADKENLEKKISELHNSGTHYSDGGEYEESIGKKIYVEYSRYVKKYPLDYCIKQTLAWHIYMMLWHCDKGYEIPEKEKESLYNEAVKLLLSLSNQDNDPGRLIETKQILVNLYVYKNELEKAEAVALELPDVHDIRASMLIKIYDQKGDCEKCLEIANRMNNLFGYSNLCWFATRAERISKFGNVRKHEAIAAWRDLEKIARCHHSMAKNNDTFWWVLRSLWGRSNDCIAISDFDGALTAIEEMRDFGVEHYNERKTAGADKAELQSIIDLMQNSLKRGYFLSLGNPDNVIDNDPRFRACQQTFIDIEKELK